MSNQPKTSKVPFHLIPKRALAEVALAMKVGANSHGAFDYRTGAPKLLTDYLSAIERHAAKVMDRVDHEFIPIEGKDPVAISHVAFIAAGALVLLDAMAEGKVVDDRPATVHDLAARYNTWQKLNEVSGMLDLKEPEVQEPPEDASRDADFDGERICGNCANWCRDNESDSGECAVDQETKEKDHSCDQFDPLPKW